MAVDTINGQSGYVVDIIGTKTFFIPLESIAVPDVATIDGLKTTQAAVAGFADINVGGNKLVGDSTGLADGAYTLGVSVDSGVSTEITVTIAGGLNTFADLITAIDTGLTNASLAATSAVTGGNIRITSTSVANDSKIVLVDGVTGGLLAALASFVALDAPVDGNVLTALAGVSRIGVALSVMYADAIEVFDTVSAQTLLTGADLAAASAGYVQAELQAVIDMVNALKERVGFKNF